MACSQHSPQSKWKNGPDWKTPGHLVNNSSGFWLTKVETQSWTGQGYQVSIFILDISATQHIDFFDKMSTLIFFNSVDDLSSFFECFKLTFLGYSFPSSLTFKVESSGCSNITRSRCKKSHHRQENMWAQKQSQINIFFPEQNSFFYLTKILSHSIAHNIKP